MTKKYTINAEGKILGRVASEAAKILIGKNFPGYKPNKISNVSVIIENASKTKMSESRMNDIFHEKYSGHPGGLKKETNAKILEKKGWKELYEMTIYGMLPGNKLRPKIMKNLTIND